MKKIKLLVPCFGHVAGTQLPIDDELAEWAVKNKKAEFVKEKKEK